MSVITLMLSVFITITVIVTLVWLVVHPEPLKGAIAYFFPDVRYDPNSNAEFINGHTLYSRPESKHDKLIVIFIGGCGMFSSVSSVYGFANAVDEKLGDRFDILVFTYPIRFKNKIWDSMRAINRHLLPYISYKDVHAVGISFGSLLAGAFYQKETSLNKARLMKIPQIGMEFKSLSIFSGVFECRFNSKILTNLFRMYIMTDTPSLINYTCYGIDIPKFVVSAKSDFLVAQTVKFVQTEPCEHVVFDTISLPHAFIQIITLDESQKALEQFIRFIETSDGGTDRSHTQQQRQYNIVQGFH